MVIFTCELESTFDAVDRVVPLATAAIKEKFIFMSERYLFNINFMLREILNNAVEHGNHFNIDKEVLCEIEYVVPKLYFRIKDQGLGIKPEDILTASHDPKSLLRERNRGHQTIIDMEFDIEIKASQVIIILNLSQEERLWKNNY
ncbi:ATP-binding protein [Fusibacter bizertensis]|uniref:ATP-binding protein n=1 Tax=Fusibacter bizertensis TaxID=1488331 RepID=A0ABT6NCX4_9FIRM|nr:ATP-binding protein [Fusibacter bizertensis]MDH8678246.1 ATP-binding protein [Fusibacter bizertensis]